MLTTISPAGIEELFVACGVAVTDDEPPMGVVMPPTDEVVRLFASYGSFFALFLYTTLHI